MGLATDSDCIVVTFPAARISSFRRAGSRSSSTDASGTGTLDAGLRIVRNQMLNSGRQNLKVTLHAMRVFSRNWKGWAGASQ